MGEVYALGDNLLRALAPLAGDAAAIDAYMRKWVAVNGGPAVGLVALAAIRTTFVHCLTRVGEVPPGSLAYTTIKEDPDDR